MAKQEIEFVDVIADDDFSVPGGMVRKDEPFRCTRKKAKELVAIKKAHYPTDDERAELAGKSDDEAADQEKLADASAENAPAKAEASKATKSTRSSK